MVYMYYSKSI